MSKVYRHLTMFALVILSHSCRAQNSGEIWVAKAGGKYFKVSTRKPIRVFTTKYNRISGNFEVIDSATIKVGEAKFKLSDIRIIKTKHQPSISRQFTKAWMISAGIVMESLIIYNIIDYSRYPQGEYNEYGYFILPGTVASAALIYWGISLTRFHTYHLETGDKIKLKR